MEKKAKEYALRLIIQKTLALLCFLIGSRFLITWQAYTYFGTVFILTILSLIITYKTNPETLAQRGKIITDSPLWDKAILSIYWLIYFFIIYFIAGFETKNAYKNNFLFVFGIVFTILSAILSTAAIIANTYLESTARIQTERNQKVISSGVYAFVRHPTYLSVIISCFGIALVFISAFVWLAAFIIIILSFIRTYLEDKMLKENLEGYIEYSNKVKYRLIPFIW